MQLMLRVRTLCGWRIYKPCMRYSNPHWNKQCASSCGVIGTKKAPDPVILSLRTSTGKSYKNSALHLLTSNPSANSDERSKAWEYVNDLLNWNHRWCDHMLNALSQTAFAASVDFFAFKRRCRAKHLPSKGRVWSSKWRRIYRHSDGRGRTCLVSSSASK